MRAKWASFTVSGRVYESRRDVPAPGSSSCCQILVGGTSVSSGRPTGKRIHGKLKDWMDLERMPTRLAFPTVRLAGIHGATLYNTECRVE